MPRPSRQARLPGMDDPDDTPSAPGAAAGPEPAGAAAPASHAGPAERQGEGANRVPPPAAAPPSPPPAAAAGPSDAARALEGRSVWAIDANSLIFQVFHAIPEMTSPRGEPVNAVFGFTRDLLYLLEQKRPDYLFCAFDLPGPTFRHTMFEGYKAHRAEMPDELVPQLPKIRQMVEALGVPILAVEGFEADDILATLAQRTEAAGGQCVIVTSDKDCRQLISDRVRLYNVRKDQSFDAEALAADWGIAPGQVVDFQGLVGDSVDAVPGVPGIGPKGAAELLAKYGTLDAVLDRAHEITAAKRRQNLIDYREQALLSRRLATLDRHVPLDVPWEAGRAGQIDAPRALALCQEFGFRRLAEQIRAATGAAAGGAASADDPASVTHPAELAGDDAAPSPAARFGIGAAPLTRADSPAWQAHYQTVDTPAALDRLAARLREAGRSCLDTETTSVSARAADLVGYAFAVAPGEAYYVPVRAPAGEPCLDPALVRERLRPVLEDPALEKIGQNLKYDWLVLRRAGIELAGLGFDTMLASYLLEAGERTHNLDDLARRYLGHETIKISELIGTGKQQRRMDEVPVARVTEYAAEDADVPLRLVGLLAPRLAEAGLDRLFREVELPLVEVLVDMEWHGIRLDVARLRALSAEYTERLAALEAEIHALAGHPFNIASPKQLQQVLFAELGLPIVRKTKTGPSTDADVLEELAPRHPLPARVLAYRQFAKLQGTYVDALPELVHPETGRVHCSFHQTVAATGRLSSSDPNLQNIPIRTPEGREIRSAFLPGEEGWRLVAADYSQIELRFLAHFSGDETLRAAFAADEDIHARVASEVYAVPLDAVTKDMRRNAKAVNFGVIYGQSPFGLARALGIEQDEAARFIDRYFARYPRVEGFLAEVLDACRRQGYVATILGRRRAIEGVRPNPGRQKNLPERTAINTVIQGSAADLIKLAMLAVHRRLKRDGLKSRMLLQIHDELVFEAPADEVAPLTDLVRAEMARVMSLAVPLRVDITSGRHWGEIE